jgi:hypothetical protein
MTRSVRNPFLRLPVTDENDVEQILVHADHIVQIEESDPTSCELYLSNGEVHQVELGIEELSTMLNQVYGHELTTAAMLED